MTVAADEAQGVPMAHNYDIFDGHAYSAEDVLDLQQYNGNLFFLLPFAENAQPSSVCRPAWNRLTLLPTPFSLPQFKVAHKGVGVYSEMWFTCPIVNRLKACTHCNSSSTGTVTPYSNIQKLVYGFAASKKQGEFYTSM